MTAVDLARWEGDVVLSDGGTVHVRPIRPSDAETLVAMHGRLSAESIYFRFFSPKPRLTDKEIERFTTVDFKDRVALVAMLGDDMVAVARFDRWQHEDEAEVAFTVDDAHHGRGIATVLLEHLAAMAREIGLKRFTAEHLRRCGRVLAAPVPGLACSSPAAGLAVGRQPPAVAAPVELFRRLDLATARAALGGGHAAVPSR